MKKGDDQLEAELTARAVFERREIEKMLEQIARLRAVLDKMQALLDEVGRETHTKRGR